ncbi:MAG: PepSY domain-containing protein [Flaviflexus sp.]|uniref:PepSY domain-containing protein n=1 Tax=Flaviflexus sp. TaxID=1969482 RepID=UPI00352CA645
MNRMTTLGAAAALALTLAACSDSNDTEADETPVDTAAQSIEPQDSGSGEDGVDDRNEEGGDATDDSGDATTPSEDNASGTTPDRTTDLRDYEFEISLREAIELSNSHTGGGTIHQAGMDWSDDSGAWVWEIDTIGDGREWELEIDATTGEILVRDQDDEDDNEQAVDPYGDVDYLSAMQTATGEVAGTVTGWSLDWDDDREIYTIEISTGGDDTDVEIDAISGEIVEIDD